MLGFVKEIFRKENKGMIVSAPIENKEQNIEKVLGALIRLNEIDKADKAISRDELLNKIFSKTIDSIIRIDDNGKPTSVAMDSVGDRITTKYRFKPGTDAVLDMFQDYFIGFNACAILKQNKMIGSACEIPAKDAIATDYRLTYQDESDIDKDESEDIESTDEKVKLLADLKRKSDQDFKIKDACKKLTINKKTFGYGLAIPIFNDKTLNLSLPYNIDSIKPNSYEGFKIVDPYWIMPEFDAESIQNPDSLYFQVPTWYRLNGGKLIHRSWCVKVINEEVSDVLKPAYYYGGVPLTQQIYKRVYCAEKTADEVPMLVLSKRLLTMGGNFLNGILDEDRLRTAINTLVETRNNHGVWIHDTEQSPTQLDTSLAGLDESVMTQYQLVASLAEMPATKLLKTTPKGFNATGEYEMKDYAQTLIDIQENDFIPLINRHNEMMTKSECGKVIYLNVVFNPVDTPTAKEIAETEQIRANTASVYIGSGVISPEEQRVILKGDADGAYTMLQDKEEMTEGEEAEWLEGGIDIDGIINGAFGVATDGDFKEDDHPRDKGGKFTKGGGGGGASKSESASSNKEIKEKPNEIYKKFSTEKLKSDVEKIEQDLENGKYNNNERQKTIALGAIESIKREISVREASNYKDSEKEVKNKESIMHANNVKEFKVDDPDEPIHDLIDKTTEWNKNLSQAQKHSISTYTGDTYEEINRGLRTGVDKYGNKEQADNIAEAISKYELTEDVKVFRSMPYKDVFGDKSPEQLVGEVEKDSAFASTSFSREGVGNIAKNFPPPFAQKAILEIDVPKGIGRGAYIFDHSATPEEQEFLLQKGSRYKIYEQSKNSDGNIVFKAKLLV